MPILLLLFTAMTANALVVRGERVPQLTTAQRNSISAIDAATAKGQTIYNTDNDCLEYWNGIKWVSLCLGTANIGLTGDPCGAYDPSNPPTAASDGSDTPCTYTPKDDPECVVPSGQAYQVYLTAGAAYATLTVDELTSAFSVQFQQNNSANPRIAVVRVVNNCSGEFQDFLFSQAGATCPAGATAFTLATQPTGNSICGDNGAVIAYVTAPQAGIEYLWEYSGVVVHTGNSMEITRAGKYTVYAGLLGCQTPAPQSVTITKTIGNAAGAPTVTATNSGVLCSGGNVILTANNVTGTQVNWFHNGTLAANTGANITLNGAAAAGEWFAVQSDGAGCGSRQSNTVSLTDQTTGSTALTAPVATVNGTALSGALVVCKGGTLELAVTNSYPAGTIYEWFDNGVSIGRGTDPVMYTVAPDKTQMILSVQVSNNSGGCPNTALSSQISITFTAPAAPTINNNKATAAICGGTPAMLTADPSSAGNGNYEWFLNSAAVPSATASNASYATTAAGSYTVRYKDGNGCWSLVSSAITVHQSAAISLSWLVAPSGTATIGDNESYSVLASPTPDSYEWTSSNTSVATVTPLDGGKSSSVSYLSAGTTTLTVSATNACGTVPISKPITVSAGCTPLTGVSLNPTGIVTRRLTAAGAPYTGEGSTLFSASAVGGTAPYTYEFFVGGASQGAASATSTFTYTTPTTANDYLVTVKAYNCPNPAPTPGTATSSATTVRVSKDAQPDVSGNYRLSGKTCFDVNQTEGTAANGCMPKSSRTADLTASSRTFTYTFINSASYTNLTYEIGGDNSSLATVSGNGSTTATVTFISNIVSLATGKDKTQALKLKLIAKYTDNTATPRQIELDLSVQDCSCGCTVKTQAGGWITFMCYNLGVAEATKTKTPQQMWETTSPTGATTDNTIYGDLYQWGRKTDGHEKRTSQSYPTNNTSSETGPIANANVDANGQVNSGHASYGKFIKNNASPYDWRATQVTTLWGATKTANDPCPAGWRVPTQAEWGSIFRGGTTSGTSGTATANTWTWNSSGTAGYKISPDGGTNYTLFLPAAGSRLYRTSALSSAGSSGYYWSSTVTSTTSYYLYFNSSDVYPGNNYYRAFGFSVRCVAE